MRRSAGLHFVPLVIAVLSCGVALAQSGSAVPETGRLLTLHFFQPGGEKITRPINFAFQMAPVQAASGAALPRTVTGGGWTRASTNNAIFQLTLPTGKEQRILLGIDGDGRRYADTLVILTTSKDLLIYPVFLTPPEVTGENRYRPGTNSYDDLVPATAKEVVTLALKAGDEGRLGQAITEFSRALQIAPRFPSALNQLGLLYYRNGRLNEAVTAFNQAVSIRDRAPHAYLNLGVTLNRLGQYVESIRLLTSLLEANQEMTRIRIPLAEALVQIQQWDAAVEMLQPAMAEMDKLPADLQSETRFIIARTMFREERYRATVREVTRALANPGPWSNTPSAWLLLGRAHLELKQDKEAEAALIKATETSGGAPGVPHFYLGQLYARQNQIERAIKALETFQKTGREESDAATQQEARSLLSRLRNELKTRP